MPDLNQRVTAAIFRAEGLERDAHAAFAEVSRLEEEIAAICPAGTLEGDVARRGAVTAALSANDPQRAVNLAREYLAGPVAISGLLELQAEALAARRKTWKV